MKFDYLAIMEKCRKVEKNCRARKMTVEWLLRAINYLTYHPDVQEVRVDTGAVANSYRGGAEATFVWLHRDGRWEVARRKARNVAYGDTGAITYRHNRIFKDNQPTE